MGAGGLEPPQSCDLRILSPLRLPFRHAPKLVTATVFKFQICTELCMESCKTVPTLAPSTGPVEA